MRMRAIKRQTPDHFTFVSKRSSEFAGTLVLGAAIFFVFYGNEMKTFETNLMINNEQ